MKKLLIILTLFGIILNSYSQTVINLSPDSTLYDLHILPPSAVVPAFVYDTTSAPYIDSIPIAYDQKYVIPDDTDNSDYVGVFHVTPVDSIINEHSSYAYSITAGNTGTAFAINSSTGLLTVNDYTAISAGSDPEFSLTIKVVADGADSANYTASVNVIHDDSCRWIDLDAVSNGTGMTRDDPRNTFAQYTQNDTSSHAYFIKRGSTGVDDRMNTFSNGTSAKPTIFAAYGVGDKPRMDSCSASGAFVVGEFNAGSCLKSGNQYVEFYDIDINYAASDSFGNGITVRCDPLGLEFHRMDLLTNMGNGALYVQSPPGLGESNIHAQSAVYGGTYKNLGSHGIKLARGFNVNSVYSWENDRNGISMADSCGTFYSLYMDAEDQYGIEVAGENDTVVGCVVRDNYQGIVFTGTTDLPVHRAFINRNLVDSSTSMQVRLSETVDLEFRDNEISRNIIRDGSDRGMRIDGNQDGILIRWNWFINNSSDGIGIFENKAKGSLVTIFDNHFWDNGDDGFNQGPALGASDTLRIVNNVFYNSTSNEINIESDTGNVELINNLIQATSIAGTPTVNTTNSQRFDLVIDSAKYNFVPDTSDLFVGLIARAGTDMSYDYDINWNPWATTPSIGAFEVDYTPDTTPPDSANSFEVSSPNKDSVRMQISGFDASAYSFVVNYTFEGDTWPTDTTDGTKQFSFNVSDTALYNDTTFAVSLSSDTTLRFSLWGTDPSGNVSDPNRDTVAVDTSAAFNPGDLANMELWLSGGVGVTVATGVSNWADQSGNSRDMKQSTTSLQPVYGGSTLNGINAITLPASEDDYIQLDSRLDVAGDFTIFFVDSIDGSLRYPWGDNNSGDFRVGHSTSLFRFSYDFTNLNFSDTWSAGWHIFELIKRADDSIHLFVDGIEAANSPLKEADTGVDLELIRIFDRAGEITEGCDFIEFIIYSDEKGTGELSNIRTWLENKYGL